MFITSTLFSAGIAAAAHTPLPNANHIFNAIHDSTRQFDSLLHRIGMSLFIATVPQGTELYHGSSWPYRINDTEWIAFEPEHALMFARENMSPPFKRTRPPEIVDSSRSGLEQAMTTGRQSRSRLAGMNHSISGAADFADPIHAYFHTYKAKRDLRLLYIDGHSATEFFEGTSDTQICILMHGMKIHDVQPSASGEHQHSAQKVLSSEDPSPDTCYAWDDIDYASRMCDLAENQWKGRIDGFMRMEGGFEIIFCNFDEGLDLQDIKASRKPFWDGYLSDPFSMAQAIAARYHGVGNSRIKVDYGEFVTMYTYPEALFWDDKNKPRINASAELGVVKQAVDQMVMRDHESKHNWQQIVDLVVARYSDRLQVLSNLELFESHDMFLREVDRAVRPFIDYSDRNDTTETIRCAMQFFPTLSEGDISTVAYKAILSVTTTICTSLLKTTRSQTIAEGLEMLRGLKEWLSWTSFKGCGGCAPHELCWVPIWPKEEFPFSFLNRAGGNDSSNKAVQPWDEPVCLNGTAIIDRDEYIHAPW